MYAGGCAASKWAGEVLVQEAHDAYGLPVTVLRSDMVLAHRRHAGQLNVPDMFIRLLFGLVATGSAPTTTACPSTFVAQAVNTLGAANTDGHRTYNVVNPHDDGISLDTFVDRLTDADHAIHRIEDYAAWFTRFVRDTGIDGGGIPHLPPELITKYATALRHLDLL